MGSREHLSPASHSNVRFDSGFWQTRIEVNRDVTLPIQFKQLINTGRVDALWLHWKPGQPNKPHEFWDSDIGKWIEAASYSLAATPDETLKKQIDDTIALLASSQQPDGYLNTHFMTVRPEERWTNLRDAHELYCAGHLIEAAVAHFSATGSRSLLDLMCRYADYIDSLFGPEDGKNRGYCGHPEIELALIRLHRATGNDRYLKLAKFFVDERGREPNYFQIEAATRGQDPKKNWANLDYYQAHKPVREQKDADGHSVRMLYLLSGMIDVAAATGDAELLSTCKTLWQSATERRMYVTGGVGSQRHGERFTFDYDLPNETAYAETCAAIALVFAAHRLMQIEPDRKYADVMELALYNGISSGVSLAGDTFLYANPLTVHRETLDQPAQSHTSARRQEWFGCACCPPNVARLLGSLGQYVYSTSNDAIYVHLYAGGEADLLVGDRKVRIAQQTEYPWDGKVKFTVSPESPGKFTLALRIPGWCEGATIKVNGERMKLNKNVGRAYVRIRRQWSAGDRVTLKLPMPVRRMVTNPRCRNNIGKVALQRGPIVYCFEQIDNGPDLHLLSLPHNSKLRERFEPNLLGGVVTISASGKQIDAKQFGNMLYSNTARQTKLGSRRIKAVPYCVWGNREVGEMRVWLDATKR